MKEPLPEWTAGYKEFKNFLHNDMGISKEQIQEILAKIAREEVLALLGQNGQFVRQAIREIIRDEIKNALINEHYPTMKGQTLFYDKNGNNPFNKFISQVMKEEVLHIFREKFEVGIEIKENNPNT